VSLIAVEARYAETLLTVNSELIRHQTIHAQQIDELCASYYRCEDQRMQLEADRDQAASSSSWWGVAATISRWAGACLSIATGGLTGALAACAVIALEAANGAGLIERAGRALDGVMPGGYQAVQLASQGVSIAASIAGASMGTTGAPALLKGLVVTGQSVTALGQGIETYKLGNARAGLAECEAQLTAMQNRIRVEQQMFRKHELERQQNLLRTPETLFIDLQRR